jgi:hypothetical protein
MSLVKAREALRLKRLAKEKELKESEQKQKIEEPPTKPASEEVFIPKDETVPTLMDVEMKSEEEFFTKEAEEPIPTPPQKKINLMDLFLIPPKMDDIVSTPITPQRSKLIPPPPPQKKRKREASSSEEDASQSSEEETKTKNLPPLGSNKTKVSTPSKSNSNTLSSIKTKVGGLVNQIPPGVTSAIRGVGTNLSGAAWIALLILIRGLAQNFLQNQTKRLMPIGNQPVYQAQQDPRPPSSVVMAQNRPDTTNDFGAFTR